MEPVRRKPGQWFLIDGEWSQSVAGHLRAGRFGGIARGEFETSRRKLPNGRYQVYARFVGGGGEGEPHHAGWTREEAVASDLPRRLVGGHVEVQLPAEDGWPPRWVNTSDLPGDPPVF